MKCSKCNKEKQKKEFAKNKSAKIGYNSWCKTCHAEHQKLVHEQNKVKSNKRIQELRAIRREELRKFIVQYLKSHPCIKCKQANILCLDFDHRDPGQKEFNVSTMISQVPRMERVLEEIKKCDVLCANCHRIKTAHDVGNFKIQYMDASSNG